MSSKLGTAQPQLVLNLFKDHLWLFVFQCPTLMRMGMNKRVKVVNKTQVCHYCLDHPAIVDGSHEAVCRAEKTRTSHCWRCITRPQKALLDLPDDENAQKLRDITN